MYRFPLYTLLLLLSVCFIECNSDKTLRSKKRDKSDALFSYSRKKPFKYGYAYTLEECKNFADIAKEYGIKKGDIIADVGAASGYTDGAMSLVCDSVTFYIEDINKVYLNQKELNKMVKYYSEIRKTPQTNKFYFTIGNERRTNLPDSIFDKVIVNNAFHEFNYVSDMLNDIYKKLKPDGQLIISENFSIENSPVVLRGCFISGYTTNEVVELLSFHGLYLTKMTFPEWINNNMLIFEKDKKKSDIYLIKKEDVNAYVKNINMLDSAAFSEDSLKTKALGDSLLLRLKEINEIYPFLESWINGLGYDWMNRKYYQKAINVFMVNVLLYPDSANVYDSLGEAYMENKQYELALKYYSKSLELNPSNTSGAEKINKLKNLLRN